jgi:hypothetical protein
LVGLRSASQTVLIGAIASLTWAVLAGVACSSDDQPASPTASQPTTQAAATQPAPAPDPQPDPGPILTESETWSQDQALAKLSDDATRLSAAVRLVRLADATPLCLPDPLPIELARRLRVMVLSESRWALGLSTTDQRRMASPVLIDSDGQVTLPAEGIEEEIALLCCAEDTELFPHLLLLHDHVLIVEDELQSALVARSPSGLHFNLLFDGDYPYVALLWRVPAQSDDEADPPVPAEPVELTRYKWDPWELAFSGPLCDKLPDPPGGLFELDLEASEALIPVGGVIPEPPEIATPPAQAQEDEATPY